MQLYASARDDGHLTITNSFIVLVILVSVVLAVLGTEPTIYRTHRDNFLYAEMAFGVIFLVEYCARVWAAPEEPGSGSAWTKRWRFIFSPFGLIDLVVVGLTLFPFFFSSAPVLRLLRLIRLASLMKFGRFSMALREIGAAVSERRYDLLVTFVLAMTLVLFGATALFWAEGKAQPDAFGSIPRAMWWSIITLTAVGYGDVTPITPLGKLFGAVVALSSIAMVAMPTGILAVSFSDAMKRHRAKLAREEEAKTKYDG